MKFWNSDIINPVYSNINATFKKFKEQSSYYFYLNLFNICIKHNISVHSLKVTISSLFSKKKTFYSILRKDISILSFILFSLVSVHLHGKLDGFPNLYVNYISPLHTLLISNYIKVYTAAVVMQVSQTGIFIQCVSRIEG